MLGHRILWAAVLCAGVSAAYAQTETPLAFGVINQRSVPLTAQAWNPILAYVTKKTGWR